MKTSLFAFRFGIVLLLFSVASTRAATVTVCDEPSLRSAVAAGGTIVFDCDGYIALSNTITISSDTILDGSGRTIIISGNNAVRVFYVNPGVQFTVRKLSIINGSVVGTNNLVGGQPGEDAFGAGVYNRGTFILVDSSLVGHMARGGMGGPRVSSPPGAPAGSGGTAGGAAIYNDGGVVQCSGSFLMANSTTGGRGGDDGGAGFQMGAGGSALGGASFSRGGSYTFSTTLFSQNSARGGDADGGPGFLAYGQAGSGIGGAIYSLMATGTVSYSGFHSNHAAGASVPWTGGSGAGTGGAMTISNGVVTIDGSTFSENMAQAGSNARHGSREPGSGGAIATSGTLTLRECVLAQNSARALPNGTEGSQTRGGAIDSSGDLSITGCTFSGNLARGGDSGGAASPFGWPAGTADGGAIRNVGVLAVTNSTFAGNFARGGDRRVGFSDIPGGDGNGGAIANLMAMTLTHATLGSNSAVRGAFMTVAAGQGWGGGLYSGSNAISTLQNVLLGGNISGSNGFGPLIDAGNNLSSDGSCQFTAPGSLNDTDPRLSPLDDFGGPTPTMALLAGSPAIDAANSTHCTPTDQRGVARPFGAGCDIGAFESAPPYSIRGIIYGYKPVNGISVSAGLTSTTSDSAGKYILLGVAPGTYNVVPSSPEAVCLPNSRSVDVGFDVLGVDFKAYRVNALTVDSFSNLTVSIVYAGASGQVREIQKSSELGGPWMPFSTNTVGPNGVFTLDLPVVSPEPHEYLRARRVEP